MKDIELSHLRVVDKYELRIKLFRSEILNCYTHKFTALLTTTCNCKGVLRSEVMVPSLVHLRVPSI